jgi:4-hydroxybenzoate polyprenyltransferase
MNRFIAFMRCSSCRFAAFYFLSFYIALLDTGNGEWYWVIFSAFFWLLHSTGTELTNRLSDQVEDRINRKERTFLCDKVGFSLIQKLSIIIWSIIIIVDIVWLLRYPNPNLAVLLILGLLAGINYSYGMRFKTKRYLSLFALTFPFGGPFLIGWSVYNPLPAAAENLTALVYRGGPVIFLIGIFIASLAGVKDITDVSGDERVGYQSLWVSLVRQHATKIIICIVTAPFLCLLLMLYTQVLPLRFAGLLIFMPVSLILAFCVSVARENEHQQALRELFYHYWFVFLSSALFLYVFTEAAFWTIFGTSCYWIFTSQYLHWSSGIRLWKLKVVTSLIRQYKF